jgi:PIN domain nuclease of toxin-antitoxin system
VSSSVLDASALMALLKQETGHEQVATLVRTGAAMSTVNLSEVIAKLDEAGVPVASIRTTLEGFRLELVPFDSDAAYAAGQLRTQTKQAGLSFGDRACIALAEARALPIATADRMWANLSLAIPVQFIR